jgi:hypothetical protein
MIAIGGSIGTGLFMACGIAISQSGPGAPWSRSLSSVFLSGHPCAEAVVNMAEHLLTWIEKDISRGDGRTAGGCPLAAVQSRSG